MRTFLRHIATGQYFQSLERWTPDRDDAYDFGIIAKAMKVAHKTRVPDLELVLSLDDPDEVAATPFEKLLHGLLHTRKRPNAGKRGSRPWRAAVSN
ncbi:MAG: hypothetical protein ACLQU3_28500 [Limisphaerales bacterium]